MEQYLCFTRKERLKLKKILERVGPILLRNHESSLSFQVAHKLLNDFIHPLSPISKSKRLIQKLISIMENQSSDIEKRQTIASFLKELYTNCKFEVNKGLIEFLKRGGLDKKNANLLN